jgi:hypothetical protein
MRAGMPQASRCAGKKHKKRLETDLIRSMHGIENSVSHLSRLSALLCVANPQLTTASDHGESQGTDLQHLV